MMKSIMTATLLMALAPAAAAARTPSAEDTRKAARIAEKVDQNRDGRVTRQEMQNFGIRHRLGTLINVRTWKKADVDRNGSLSIPELSNYLLYVQAEREAGRR